MSHRFLFIGFCIRLFLLFFLISWDSLSGFYNFNRVPMDKVTKRDVRKDRGFWVIFLSKTAKQNMSGFPKFDRVDLCGYFFFNIPLGLSIGFCPKKANPMKENCAMSLGVGLGGE